MYRFIFVNNLHMSLKESISGKCNVVCTSKDERNPQATVEELKMSDYVFYRTFDVKECKLSEIFPDKIAGVEGLCVLHFNQIMSIFYNL